MKLRILSVLDGFKTIIGLSLLSIAPHLSNEPIEVCGIAFDIKPFIYGIGVLFTGSGSMHKFNKSRKSKHLS